MLTDVTKDAVTVVVALSLMAGWYGRHLLQATQDVAFARTRLRNAIRVLWAARRVAAVVAFAVVVAADFWIRKHGG